MFWYALLSTITPPVCGTVFIAAGMAGAPWLAVAGRALRLGLGLYLVPIAFVVQPALLDPLGQPFEAAVAFVRVGAALWLVATALAGGADALALSWKRLAFLMAGLALLLVRLV